MQTSLSPSKTMQALLILIGVTFLAACQQSAQPDEAQPNLNSTSGEAEEADTAEEQVEVKEGFTLVWQDEFDGDAINSENWTYDLGGGGWGNHELQTYTDNAENARVEDGHLIIEAIKPDTGTRQYTSARLKTEQLHTFTYGRIEARMKLPQGQGIWSAFWMLGEDYATAVWPNSGEIDIMENIGVNSKVHGTLHGPGYFGGAGVGGTYSSSDFDISEFHIYAIEWEPNEIRWYVDDINYNVVRSTNVPGRWVFDHPFFIILNIAVGGDWPGAPNDDTEFPQQMVVDYVRVYQPLDGENTSSRSGGDMHVGSVSLEILDMEEGRQGQVFVQIVNQDGDPVEGARVNGGWLGAVRKGDTDKITGENGIAGPFLSDMTTSDGEISFCVTSVVGGGHSYNKAQNNQTCVFSEP